MYTMQLFPPCYLTPAECTKEQNNQLKESDAGASVGVSGQKRQCVTVCSIFSLSVYGTLVAPLNGKWGNYHSIWLGGATDVDESLTLLFLKNKSSF